MERGGGGQRGEGVVEEGRGVWQGWWWLHSKVWTDAHMNAKDF